MMIISILFWFIILITRGLQCRSCSWGFSTKVRDNDSPNLLPDRVSNVPHWFKYADEDRLNVEIVLKNVPPTVTKFTINYKPANCTASNDHERAVKYKEVTYVRTNLTGVNKQEVSHKFDSKVLFEPNIEVFIELLESTTSCAKKTVLLGEKVEKNKGLDKCVKDSRPCEIEIDFRSECEPAIHSVGSAVTFNCTPNNDNGILNDTVQWHQVDDKNVSIGNIPQIRTKNPVLKLFLENFDNNTFAYCTYYNTWNIPVTSKKSTVRVRKTANSNIENMPVMSYNEFEEVQFDCREYLTKTNYTQVVSIATNLSITTYDNATLTKTFKLGDNGTMLCCFFYEVEDLDNESKAVVRRVQRRYLLVYEDPDTSALALAGNRSTYYIIAGVIAAAVILSLVIIAVKCKRRSESTGEPLELDTYDTANRVVYAELDIASRGSQFIRSTEESPYAQVIGVLKDK